MRLRSIRSPPRARDLHHRALDRRQHPQPEQVDLEKTRVGARVLVPVAHLPPLHRGRDERDAVDQRARRDDHPARVLGEVARQPVRLPGKEGEPAPAAAQLAGARSGALPNAWRPGEVAGVAVTVRVARARPRGRARRPAPPPMRAVPPHAVRTAGSGPPSRDVATPIAACRRPGRVRSLRHLRRSAEREVDVLLDRLRPRLRDPGDALDLPRRQPERLADLADRAARAIGRERGDERRAIGAVALVHARDQLLADVAREVEVDVRQRGELLVEEAAEEELVLHRVDVREPREVADDRRHRRPAPPSRRQQGPHRVRPPHLGRHLARELEQLPVQDEEARQPERADDAQLLLQPRPAPRPGSDARSGSGRRSASAHSSASLRSACVVLGARVAVAEVVGEVEASAARRAAASPAPRPGGRRSAPPSPAATPARARGCRVAAAPRRRASRARGSRRSVLKQCALTRVRVDVAGRHARHPEPPRHRLQTAVERAVMAQEGPLQLDAEAVTARRPPAAGAASARRARPGARTRSGTRGPARARAPPRAGPTAAPRSARPRARACARARA